MHFHLVLDCRSLCWEGITFVLRHALYMKAIRTKAKNDKIDVW